MQSQKRDKRAAIVCIILISSFTVFSFSPTLTEIGERKHIPPDRSFELVHNYLFDYNFYLSRIRQGLNGHWLVTETYYNHPHPPSLLQIVYLLMGKIGGVMRADPETIYHAGRIVFGWTLLLLVATYAGRIYSGVWRVLAVFLITTAGSWPIPIKLATGSWRFGTYMGWWSVADSLQRITTLPHVLLGQIFLIVCIVKFQYPWRYDSDKLRQYAGHLLVWGIAGFVAGIIFPPTLVVIYIFFFLLSSVEGGKIVRRVEKSGNGWEELKVWWKTALVPRGAFGIFSALSLVYVQNTVKVLPWSALPLFDIQHRMPLPYWEYALSLGPVLPVGLLGIVLAAVRGERKLHASILWVFSVKTAFLIFQNVPTQSPLRFTEAVINIPLGILAAYAGKTVWEWTGNAQKGARRTARVILAGITASILAANISVMVSMYGWLTDQSRGKAAGTFSVPIGAQLAYPLTDFLNAVVWIRENTGRQDVVLSYVTAGNYIPAYAGNPVYIGHANTPDEDGKEKIAAAFFGGKMTRQEAEIFLSRERVSYVFFGPQEREIGSVASLNPVYPMLTPVYRNDKVMIYRRTNLPSSRKS